MFKKLFSIPDPKDDAATFANLIAQLQRTGHAEAARQFDDLLHRTPWTTSNELLTELGKALRAFKRNTPKMDKELKDAIKRCQRITRRIGHA